MRTIVRRLDGAPARIVERVRFEPGAAVLAIAITAWVFVMELAIWRRHDRYGTFDQDLGFHTQFVWQLAHGRTFSTIVGLHAFGHNSTFGYLLFAPFVWLGVSGPQLLDLVQTLAVAAGAIPVYVLARRRLGIGWPATTLALAWLLHPFVQNFVWETWHPEVMAAPFLLAAYVLADGWKWRPYWLFLVLALLWKTDVTLFVVMLGIWIAWRRNRKVGLRTIALGVLWFLGTSIMIPTFAGGATVYGGFYGDLGDTPVQVVQTSVAHPSRLAHHIANGDPIGYSRDLIAPYGFVPALAPIEAALALPQYAIDILPIPYTPRDWSYAPHYQALPLVAITIALVEGMALLHRKRRALRNPACAFVVACGLATSVAWGSLPIGVRWGYYWSEDGDPARPAKDHAVAMVGPSAGVSSQYLITAHFAERETVYTFPSPWRKQFFEEDAIPFGDPAQIQFIVLDEGIIGEEDVKLEACIRASGAFAEAYHSGPIVVLQRVATHLPTDVGCR